MNKEPIRYPITESFTSIQGEGFHSGKGATFIRVAGCNLRCPWCDTAYSFDLTKARWMNAKEIINEIKMPHQHIVITGGEPTLYDLESLVQELHKRGKYVAVETNGTNPVPDEWDIDWITASPKPGNEYALACRADELKYVVDDKFKVEYINQRAVPEGRVFLQVESGRPESAQKAYDLIQHYPERCLRLGIQLHKVLKVR